MGLASALTTALTGMTAAEAQIDVVGNNLANSQTVGFKSSKVMFATQFLQTMGLGSAPTGNAGGTNPRQTGLGVLVAEITPSFTQGTIEISSNPADLAIQGDGFFMVQGAAGEVLYTRNGVFKTNSQNELVSITGNRLLGFGVDEFFQIQTTELVPLTIPLGAQAVAQATQNVFLEGTLTPTGDIADTAEVIESAVLGDAAVPRPDASGVGISVAPRPDQEHVTRSQEAGGTLDAGATYRYRIAFVDSNGTETLASDVMTVALGGANQTIRLDTLPQHARYAGIRVYRSEANDDALYALTTLAMGETTFVDDGTLPLDTNPTNRLPAQNTINYNYSYMITYYREGEEESRPMPLNSSVNVINGRVVISDLPTPPTPPPDGGFPAYDKVRIYRNVPGQSDNFYLVATLNPGETFTDSRADAEISDLTNPANRLLDKDGPKIDSNTLLVNVVRRDGINYEPMFYEGTLSFQARKGGRSLAPKEFTITATTTVQELVDFMELAMGVQKRNDDPQNPIPPSKNNIVGESGYLEPGAEVRGDTGKLRFVSNNGVDNALAIRLGAFTLRTTTGEVYNPDLGFGSVQRAVGQSAVTDFIVYDSLGAPIQVRVTAVLESRTGTATTYRWFAESRDNDPLTGSKIAVGTGLVSFDGEGNLITTSNSTVSIDRRHSPATSPLTFDLDFSQISGLAERDAHLAASRQDGSSTGVLTSFIIGEDGVIRGVFSNGVSRDLGQVRLARFANPVGLEQRGQNLYAAGVNSGLPVMGNPGEQGIGSLIAGAVELSNTDIGKNLIDLVLATTMYRGNTRVITTAQQLFDELLNLRR